MSVVNWGEYPESCPPDASAKVFEIQRLVAEFFGVTMTDIISPRRGVALRARQVAMWLARRKTGQSYPLLARAFDRDHSTVLRNVRLIERRIAAAQEVADAEN